MNPVRAHVTISAPREEVYDLIADLSARPGWCGHYQRDYHLTRPRASGEGSGHRNSRSLRESGCWSTGSFSRPDGTSLIRVEVPPTPAA